MLKPQNCSIMAKNQAQEKIAKVNMIFYPGCSKSDNLQQPAKQGSTGNFITNLISQAINYYSPFSGNKSQSPTYPPCLENNITVPLSQSMQLLQEFDKDKCIVLYMFGFTNAPNDSMTARISSAYVQQGTWNVLVLDDSIITKTQEYNVAVSLQNELAASVGEQLDRLMDAGMKLCHLSGHSLGAQMAGAVARSMKHSVPHMILLDPAGPLFYPPFNCSKAVTKNDAECVEVLHTDAGVLGAPLPFSGGHIDYYPTRGRRTQPNCIDEKIPTPGGTSIETGCSHCRAAFYRIDSIYVPESFVAVNCPSWEDFQRGLCDKNARMTIGSCSNTSVHGKYFMRTNGEEPYGQGDAGTRTTPVKPTPLNKIIF